MLPKYMRFIHHHNLSRYVSCHNIIANMRRHLLRTCLCCLVVSVAIIIFCTFYFGFIHIKVERGNNWSSQYEALDMDSGEESEEESEQESSQEFATVGPTPDPVVDKNELFRPQADVTDIVPKQQEKSVPSADNKTPTPKTPASNSKADHKEEEDKTGLKTILLWNTASSDADYNFGLTRKPYIDHKCEVNTCRNTVDREELEEAHAVIVNPRISIQRQNDMPARTNKEQIFVFWPDLPPIITFGQMHVFNGLFNFTISYRIDSSIHLPTYKFSRRLFPLEQKPLSSRKLMSRKKPLVWINNICEQGGNFRIDYVNSLAKYIPVDVYGDCGDHACPETKVESCMREFRSVYRFMLVFEVFSCRDYTTSKVYRALSYNIIPIVMGGANYSEILPPRSYIDVLDFESPKKLATYINSLLSNQHDFLKYFDWKRYYTLEKVRASHAFCQLCKVLYSHKGVMQEGIDTEDWWEEKGKCKADMSGKVRLR